ncbi:MAG: FAD-dependent oxidoreductase, partial [Thermodesulfobacteriota bacterium]
YEKDAKIGGQLRIAGVPPHKGELLGLIPFYEAMVRKHNVCLHVNTPVDAAFIRAEAPDHIIVAEGAEPVCPPIDGIDDACVVSAWEVLKTDPFLGEDVAVIGGGAVGLETALLAAEKGTISPETLYFLFNHEAESVERLRELMNTGTSRVSVFEMLPRVGSDVGKSTKWVLMHELTRLGVTLHTQTRVTGIQDGVLTFEKDGTVSRQRFDHVINAAGARPVNDIAARIEPLGIAYSVIGDAVEPGRMNDAIHGGYLAATAI